MPCAVFTLAPINTARIRRKRAYTPYRNCQKLNTHIHTHIYTPRVRIGNTPTGVGFDPDARGGLLSSVVSSGMFEQHWPRYVVCIVHTPIVTHYGSTNCFMPDRRGSEGGGRRLIVIQIPAVC